MKDKDNEPLAFGKYKGKTPNEIADVDIGYIVWMYDNVKPRVCSKELRDACQQDEYDEEAEHDLDAHYGIDGWGEF